MDLGIAASAAAGPSGWLLTDVGKVRGEGFAAVNDRGEVIWNQLDASQLPQFRMALVWSHGKAVKLGTNGAIAHDINNRGQVVGWSDRSAGGGFVWAKGKFRSLLGRQRGNSIANAINDLGQVAGVLEPRGNSRWWQHAFLWQDGRLRDLGALGGRQTIAELINDRGEVVGTTYTESEGFRLFLWQGRHMAALSTPGWKDPHPTAINNRGQIFGVGTTVAGQAAFLWQNGTMTSFASLGGNPATAAAMNDRGQVVGWVRSAAGETRGFVWQEGKVTELGTLGGKNSEAQAINDLGQVVGESQTSSGASHAFLWQKGNMTDIGVINPISINNKGQILATMGGRIILLTPRG